MPDGFVIIDKPAGWTSMDVCAKLRGVMHEKRVGHAGTLDPMATGVLPVFVGQATKAIPFAEDGKKEYFAVLQLGITTDTQDTTGEVLSTCAVTVEQADVRAVLPQFLGEIEQIPPMYSAIKIGGKKLCDLARQGKEVERKARKITVYELELLPCDEKNCVALRVLCSKGTYIRTLCHDIGAALGCGGAMASLRRTMASGFSVNEAISLTQAVEDGEACLSAVDHLFRTYATYTIENAEQERRCRCGNPISAAVADGIYRVYAQNGTFLALSEAKDGVLTSIRNFFSAPALG